MNGQQKAVMWMGLAIVMLNLALNWSVFKALIFSGSSSAPAAKSSNQSNSILLTPFEGIASGIL